MNKEEGKSLILVLIIIIIILVGILVFKIINPNKKDSKSIKEDNGLLEEVKLGQSIHESAIEVTDEAMDKAHSLEIETFNSLFKVYEGTRKGAEIKTMFNMINSINEEKHHDKVRVEGVTSVEDINIQANYTVELSYNEEGYVNLIKIKQK